MQRRHHTGGRGKLRRGGLAGLNHILGLLGGEATFALQILTDLPGAERNVARQDRHTVVEDRDVGRLVPDVDQEVADKLATRLTVALEKPYAIGADKLHCAASKRTVALEAAGVDRDLVLPEGKRPADVAALIPREERVGTR